MNNPKLTCCLLLPCLLVACARYGTRQADIRREFYETGKIKSETVITTKAGATAVFSSKQTLEKFKASQTEKSQSIGGAGLDQQGATNTVATIRAMTDLIEATQGK